MVHASSASRNKLHVGHLNICHLRNKVLELGLFLTQSSPYHIFGVSESWLNDSVSDDAVSISGYSVFRRDAKLPGQTGLTVYVHHTVLPFTRRRYDLDSNDVECMWFEIKDHQKSPPVLVSFVYRNPASTFIWYDHFLHMLDNASVRHPHYGGSQYRHAQTTCCMGVNNYATWP